MPRSSRGGVTFGGKWQGLPELPGRLTELSGRLTGAVAEGRRGSNSGEALQNPRTATALDFLYATPSAMKS